MSNAAEQQGLSVAMCTYNGARFLKEQLDSIAVQSKLPDELIICDDRSTDGTIEIIKTFATRAPFEVRLEINRENLGSTKNFEKAIGMCSGEIIALADQDDVWYPNKLELLCEAFLSRALVGLAFSDADVVDEKLVSLGFRLWPSVRFTQAQQKRMLHGQGTQALLHHNVVTGATMAFRRKFRDIVLSIPKDWIHDGWIALLISVFADLVPICEPLIRYRKHPAQLSGPGPINQIFAERLALAKNTGASTYAALAKYFALPYERLLALPDDLSIRTAIPYFEMKINHLRTRAQMASHKSARLPRIAIELVSGRYHLFSAGWQSAAKDLFF